MEAAVARQRKGGKSLASLRTQRDAKMIDKEESRITPKFVAWVTGWNSEASTSALLAFYRFKSISFPSQAVSVFEGGIIFFIPPSFPFTS